jgi:hypothetical protein
VNEAHKINKLLISRGNNKAKLEYAECIIKNKFGANYLKQADKYFQELDKIDYLSDDDYLRYARYLKQGKFGISDDVAAINVYRKAIKKDNYVAMVELGNEILNKSFQKIEIQEAQKYHELAARKHPNLFRKKYLENLCHDKYGRSEIFLKEEQRIYNEFIQEPNVDFTLKYANALLSGRYGENSIKDSLDIFKRAVNMERSKGIRTFITIYKENKIPNCIIHEAEDLFRTLTQGEESN